MNNATSVRLFSLLRIMVMADCLININFVIKS